MCPRPKAPKMQTPAVLAQPEKVAEEEPVGASRKREDEELFGAGGIPQLRTDRAAVSPSVATGSGLRMT